MTNYELLRKDFTIEIERCYFCNRKLTSQKVYVVKNTNTGEIFPSGFHCAKKNVNADLESIPNFARYITENLKDEENRNQETNHLRNNYNQNVYGNDDNKKKAIEYIELRENKLVENFKKVSYENLKTYYTTFLEKGDLTDEEVRHILNIENAAPEIFKLNNLHKCYSYSFWIKKAIKKGYSVDFLNSILKYLYKNFKITDKQKEFVNNILGKIENFCCLI
jgi:hypothetical protein